MFTFVLKISLFILSIFVTIASSMISPEMRKQVLSDALHEILQKENNKDVSKLNDAFSFNEDLLIWRKKGKLANKQNRKIIVKDCKETSTTPSISYSTEVEDLIDGETFPFEYISDRRTYRD
uniref:Organ specific protein n=1 Tax=Parastrongyloides trichosuri TaxID=131310 RepID=A0A0N5A0N7_PARTI